MNFVDWEREYALRFLRASLLVTLVTLVTAAGVYLVTESFWGTLVSLPEKITRQSTCPVAGCSASSCHGAAPAPKLVAGQSMRCPKGGCQSTACHAADRLISHYQSPKDASLNVWIIGLPLFTLAMIAIARYA